MTYKNAAKDISLIKAVELYKTCRFAIIVNDGKHITFKGEYDEIKMQRS